MILIRGWCRIIQKGYRVILLKNSSRNLTIATVLIIGIALLLRLLLFIEPLGLLDGKFLADDSYIALTIAKQIALGHGPRFGNYLTNGFQPLYVWLMAIAFYLQPVTQLDQLAILDHVVKQALLLNIGCYLISMRCLLIHYDNVNNNR